ncbi:MAG: type IV secretion system DNA-binding domain-containing protein [bacterium]|nr:type IV secretion system DNA-binding domain-containing protein [bacterium]
MPIIAIVGIIFLITILIAVPIIYSISRKSLREQKNYERGLKMVPLLIQLPPTSDDKDIGQRDEREVLDETISKAQIIYSIIASTLQKGFKRKFYGQRHISFEIIATYGFVRFYAAVPISMVEVVTQAIVSAYPNARLDEVEEHNIFSAVGKTAGTAGGELSLKESFAYPIGTYQDIKRDPVQSLLNSLSSLDKNDGVGIQMMIRPAHSDWRKQASEVAKSKREGKKDSKAKAEAQWWLKNLFIAPVKGGEEGKDKKESKPELSSLDQQILDSIDDKTRHPGYETTIRIVASADTNMRAQSILKNVVAAYSLYDAQGKNGFKFTEAKKIDEFITSYILRFFPQENDSNILNSVELAGLYHFPDQRNTPTSQLSRQASKQVDAPRNMPDEGLFLGYNIFRGAKKSVKLQIDDRQRHIYSVGQTGTGKSTFLENLAYQDMVNGDGFAFIDPHGDSALELLARVPKERTEDIIYFAPADMEYPMGLNMFEWKTVNQKDFLIQEAINMLYKLYDPNKQGFIGARFEQIFRNAALLLMADPQGGTFVDIPKVLVDPVFMKEKLKFVTDKTVIDFWTKEWPAAQRSNDAGEVTSWVASKFGAFLSNEMMRNIIGQTKSSFDLRDIMDKKKILIVNLSKGRTGELNSRLLGMIFVMKFQAAAMSRADIPEKDRTDFALYVDEFQNFSTDSFATIMSEARKFRLNLIVANQFTTQLDEDVRDAVFGNVGTIVAFRVGQNDVDLLSKYFEPLFEPEDLLRVPNYNAIVRTLIGGVPTQPFSISTVPRMGEENPKLVDALKQLTAAKFGRPKAEVEAEIFARLATKTPPKPVAGVAGARPAGLAPGVSGTPMQGAPTPLPSSANASFLDNWMQKRSTTASGTPGQAFNPGASNLPSNQPARAYQPPVAAQPPQSRPTQTAQPVVGNPIRVAPPVAIPQPPQLISQPPVQPAVQQTVQQAPAPLVNVNANANVSYNPQHKAQSPITQDDNSRVNQAMGKLQENNHQGEINLKEHAEDTIFIDRSGNLSQKDVQTKSTNQ